MAELEIHFGVVRIKIDLIGNDENTPSIQTKIEVSINHASGHFEYTASDIWFLCSAWDQFINHLTNGNSDFPIILQSTSNEFHFEFSKIDQAYIMNLKCQDFIHGKDEISIPSLNYISKITLEEFQIVRDKFNDVLNWW